MPSQPSSPEQPSSHRNALTLAIASASSVVAAIVVSKLWGPGTLIGAAATPVIVTLVGEGLKKPAAKITVVRVSPSGTEVHERDAPPPPVAGALAERSLHRSRRKPLLIALATGLAAFVIGALVLTSSELVLGDASVASQNKRTTVFGGSARHAAPEKRTETTTTPSPTTPTTTVPDPAAPKPAETAPGPAAPSGTTPPSGPTSPSAAPGASGSGTTGP